MTGFKLIAKNKRAYFEYEISDTVEAGIALKGTEVKSIRDGKVTLGEGWVSIDEDSQVYLKQVHISHYTFGNINNHAEDRPRKLLLKKKEIIRLQNQVHAKGYSLIPLKVYLKGQYVKVQLGLGKGKKSHDKRATAKERDANRDIERALKR